MAIQDEIPKSRLTLTYRTTISGAMQEVTLPFRILVLADFSLGSGADRKINLAEREIRPLAGRNLNPIMKDMKMSLKCSVPNRIDPDNEEQLEVDMPIDSMKAFSPAQVAQSVPKIRALLLMKQLLLETQAMIDNRRDLRKLVQDIYSKPELTDALLEKLPEYKAIRLPESKAGAPA